MPLFLAHAGLTAGKTAPNIFYQANTNGRYESLCYISHIASVFSLVGSAFKLKVRLHQSLKRHKAELIPEIICFIKLFCKNSTYRVTKASPSCISLPSYPSLVLQTQWGRTSDSKYRRAPEGCQKADSSGLFRWGMGNASPLASDLRCWPKVLNTKILLKLPCLSRAIIL